MKKDRHDEFISRHSSNILPTLNPDTVIMRLENIQDEYDTLKQALSGAEEIDIANLSILNYYVVSCVTCLEWHAKGRLSDLIAWSPEHLSDADLGNIKSVKVAHRMKTIAHFAAASRNVSSLDDYKGIFDRVFTAMGQGNATMDIIRELMMSDGVNLVEEAFSRRHLLVHEINMTEVGPVMLRDCFDFSSAAQMIETTLSIVKAIETEIARHAPKDFPNIMDGNSEQDRYIALILDVIEKITHEVSRSNEPSYIESWSEYAEQYQIDLYKITSRIDDLPMLYPARWVDSRSPLKLLVLRQNYQYLRALLDEVKSSIFDEGFSSI